MADYCAKCRGTGWVAVEVTDEEGNVEVTTLRKCICAYAKELRAHLGDEIATAPTLKRSSPLFVPGKSDLTGTNLFIKGYWHDILPHLKWALTFKTPAFKFSSVTDERLRTVYLGAESYAQRARSTRDDVPTFNSLGDIVGRQFNLVIVRLGYLGYSNKAMPGILKEALLLREALGLATWLIETPDSIFGPGHRSHSDELALYIENDFQTIAISGITRAAPAAIPETKPTVAKKAAIPVEDVSLDDYVETMEMPDPGAYSTKAAPAPRAAPPTTEWSQVSDSGQRPKHKAWRPGKPRGGGPI